MKHKKFITKQINEYLPRYLTSEQVFKIFFKNNLKSRQQFSEGLTETIQEQHCQDSPMMESLSRGGLAIFSTILSP